MGLNFTPLWAALEGGENSGLALLWLAKLIGGTPEKIRKASSDDLYWLVEQYPHLAIDTLAAVISIFQHERHLAKIDSMSSPYYRLESILENEIIISELKDYGFIPEDIIVALDILPVTFYGGPSKGPDPLLSNVKNKFFPEGVPVGHLL